MDENINEQIHSLYYKIYQLEVRKEIIRMVSPKIDIIGWETL